MGKNQDPGSGINIPDPQHCSFEKISCMDISKELGSNDKGAIKFSQAKTLKQVCERET
jgi:hypothetical protein